jgi:hypothetical protein
MEPLISTTNIMLDEPEEEEEEASWMAGGGITRYSTVGF